jgi:hypothetical protein
MTDTLDPLSRVSFFHNSIDEWPKRVTFPRANF